MVNKTDVIEVPKVGLVSSERDPKAPSDIYKVEKVERGYQVFYYYPRGQHAGTVKRPVDDGYVYTKRQAAHHRCKRLNDAHHSANIFTVHVQIDAQRDGCKAIIRALQAGNVGGIAVYDPLRDGEQQEDRIITCQRLCRFHKDDFDPTRDPWQQQPIVEDDFLAFLGTIRQMPEVWSLETSAHSYKYYA